MPINPNPKQVSAQDEPRQPEKEKKNSVQKPEYALSDPRYSFSDVVLNDETLDLLSDAMAMVQYRDKLLNEWDLGRVIKNSFSLCMNFYGEPGTGKTMAANAVAKQLGLKIIQVNYAEIESKYVGETSKNLVELFTQAEKKEALILFDEADALLSRRVTDMSNATDVSVNQTRSVLLSLLDTYQGMVIFTTNFISNYDPAFMRRVPHHIKFGLPNAVTRERILNHYLRDTIPNEIDCTYIAKKYEGITGADIANATLTAALHTARCGEKVLSQQVFEKQLANAIKSKQENCNSIKLISTRPGHIEEREEIMLQ